jgi:hypothetical protein
MEKYKPALIKKFRNAAMFLVVIPALMALIASGCGGDDDDNDNNKNDAAIESETGTLTLSLMDAASDEYKAVYITISEVRAKLAEEGSDGTVNEDNPDTTDWEVIASNPGTYNLLELVNGMMEQLGVTELPTGHYPQMRLYLGTEKLEGHPYANYVIDQGDIAHELFIPSGYQSGIKLVNGFDIVAGVSKELVLDFDARKSIIKAGNSGKIILKPTIKVIDVTGRPVVTGTVYEEDGTTPVPGAYVSAQIYNPDAADVKDRIISAGTIADDNGEYRIILEEGLTYNIVAYMEGYAPNYMELADTQLNEAYEARNINLSAASAITIPVSVNISEEPSEGEVQSATISFRQVINDTEIEVICGNFEDQGGSGSVEISLPAGTYNIVSSSDDFDTQFLPEVVVSDGYELNIVFGDPL